MNANRNPGKIFVVYKAKPIHEGSQVELKALLFATEDPILANSEKDRINNERTSYERHTECITYRVEPLPILSRRKTRHPFMRGQNQRGLFDPELHEKDGNVAESVTQPEIKTRGRLTRRTPQTCSLLA